MGSSVGTAEERLVRRLPLPGLLRRSLEVRMVCTATVIGLLLIVLLLTFVTDRIRSEVFADQRDVILADAALRASVAQAEFDSTTAVTVDEVSAAAERQVNGAKNSITSSGGVGVLMLRNEEETSTTVVNDLETDTRLRRTNPGAAEHVRAGDLDIDVAGHQVKRGESVISLTPLEFELLVTLARSPWKVFTREELLSQVWGYQHPADTRLVNVHVQRLRAKIEKDPERPSIVVTVRGVGYRVGESA